VLALQGPHSRSVLGSVTDAPLDNVSFRWLSVRQLQVAGAPMWVLRLSYAGELGYELHGPREYLPAVYDALWSAGESYGIRDYGSFAMNVMRLENAFPGAAELTNEVTLPEANQMRFVKLDKGDFLGRDQTMHSRDNPLPWLCAHLAIEPDERTEKDERRPMGDGHRSVKPEGIADGHRRRGDGDGRRMAEPNGIADDHCRREAAAGSALPEPEAISDGNGGEAVLHEGSVVGSVTSIAYGHSVGKVLAFAYIKPHAAAPGTRLEVLILGKPRPAVVLDKPLYDPGNELPRQDVQPAAARA